PSYPGLRGKKRKPMASSLMRPKSSLMPPFNSLLGRNKFPVPMRRELPRKVLILLRYLGPFPRSEHQIARKFPVNSLLPGNSERETSSLLTVSSSRESDANSLFGGLSSISVDGGGSGHPPRCARRRSPRFRRTESAPGLVQCPLDPLP